MDSFKLKGSLLKSSTSRSQHDSWATSDSITTEAWGELSRAVSSGEPPRPSTGPTAPPGWPFQQTKESAAWNHLLALSQKSSSCSTALTWVMCLFLFGGHFDNRSTATSFVWLIWPCFQRHVFTAHGSKLHIRIEASHWEQIMSEWCKDFSFKQPHIGTAGGIMDVNQSIYN